MRWEPYCDRAVEVSWGQKPKACVSNLVNRSPTDNSRSKDRLDYWIWLAKLAEKGKITSVFIADSYAGHNIYGGSADASYRGGSHIGKLDPLMTVSAMAGKLMRLKTTILRRNKVLRIDSFSLLGNFWSETILIRWFSQAVTQSVSFGITASTSYIREWPLAVTLQT